MMTVRRMTVSAVLMIAIGSSVALAQEPPPTPPPQGQTAPPDTARGRGQGGKGGGRLGLPPVGSNMTAQQLQDYIDVAAVIQAERDLQLTTDQYPNFVARLRKLQATRRQTQMQRNRLFREMAQLVTGPGPFKDDAVTEKLKALDDLNQRAAQEVRQAELDVDGVLAPWQRAKFRLLEERLERQKLELLRKLQAPGSGTEKAAAAPQKTIK
jgi:Spy/CpxP family protein refolding chaperone